MMSRRIYYVNSIAKNINFYRLRILSMASMFQNETIVEQQF